MQLRLSDVICQLCQEQRSGDAMHRPGYAWRRPYGS